MKIRIKSFKEATDWTEYSPNCFIHNVKDGVVRREKSDFHNGWYVRYEKDGSVQDEKDFGDNEELAKNYADKLVSQYNESKKESSNRYYVRKDYVDGDWDIIDSMTGVSVSGGYDTEEDAQVECDRMNNEE